MSLFTINRYMGDGEDGGDKEDTKQQAQSILHKIHQQAKVRKRLSTSTHKVKSPQPKTPTRTDKSDSASSSSSDDEPELKKAPKRKRLKEKESHSESVTKSKKTPKKKPVKESKREDGSKEESSSDSSSEEESPRKKLKKTQINVESTHIESTKKKKTKEPKVTKSEHVEKSPKRTKDIQKESPEKISPSKVIKKKKPINEDKEDTSSDEDSSSEEEEKGAEGERKEDEEEGEDEENTSGPLNREVGGFTVIGDVRKKKVEQVQRVLPDWLANPSVVNNDLKEATDGLQAVQGLEPHLIQKLTDNGIKHFFPVQRLVIPVLLGGHQTGHLVGAAGYRPSDICCSAPTGSGKTLAFVLPIVQSLQYRVVREVRALVVLPVRDLAAQVYKVFTAYTKGTNLKVGLLIGQKSFKNEQQNLVRKGARGLQVQADIVVATPGRLVDHIKDTPGFNLHHLRYLVIDEADRMMDDIKQDWLSQVEAAVYGGDSTRPRPQPLSAANASKLEMPLQKLLFSATLSQNPEKLQQLNLFQPRLFTAAITTTLSTSATTKTMTDPDNNSAEVSATSKTKGDFVGKFTTPAGLTEFMVMARDAGEKPLLVLYFLLHRKFHHVLVFTNSVEATHRLFHLIRLVGGVTVQEFSSSLHAAQRDRTLKKFAVGKIDVLICSDAMARGMDVEGVQCVVSYDHAPYVKTYIHRIGRTARAGKVGTAITLLEKKEVFNFKKMVREAGKDKVRELKVSKGDMRGLLPAYQRALQELPAVLEAEKKSH